MTKITPPAPRSHTSPRRRFTPPAVQRYEALQLIAGTGDMRGCVPNRVECDVNRSLRPGL